MSRFKSHYDYERRVFHDLGVSIPFYRWFVKPTLRMLKGNKCEDCGSPSKLQIHHTSLKDLNIHTLLLLCHDCHGQLHKRRKSSFISD